MAGIIGVIGALFIFLTIPSLSEDEKANESLEEKNPLKQSEKKVNAAEEGDGESNSITKAVDKSMDAVVSVINYQGGDMWQGTEPQRAGSGSGVIYKKEDGKAYVVTNHHVIDGASTIEINLSNDTKLPAKLLGSDPLLDLAVLEVDSEKIEHVIEIGKSEDLKPGQTAIAIGNPLGFLQGTVTTGVISAPDRTMPVDVNQDGMADWQSEVIQTDASINPGNSGGALININGELIGINSSKIAMEGVEGIGFAIPIDVAMPVLEDFEVYGEVKRPYLGIIPINLADIPSQYYQKKLQLPKEVTDGVIVRQVEPSSPSGQAGLQQYDVIVKLDGTEITNVIELRKFLYTEKEIGDEVEVTYYRDGKEQTAMITLEEEKSLVQQ
ncbi:trypsin-like peptidase domain-containing protein [Bacillus sp. ISL-47]|nr:trypsin-like peptidase domain-containing protein [Bacillus sp. ISL-47]MBT2688784.1 trypsin-like peptidase domain-containing protein [Bacillus sp. ISL-47]